MITPISIEQENILLGMMRWHLYCLSETLREHQIDYSQRCEELLDMIPFKFIRQAVKLGNAAPICDWAMEYFGYKYDDEKDGWFIND